MLTSSVDSLYIVVKEPFWCRNITKRIYCSFCLFETFKIWKDSKYIHHIYNSKKTVGVLWYLFVWITATTVGKLIHSAATSFFRNWGRSCTDYKCGFLCYVYGYFLIDSLWNLHAISGLHKSNRNFFLNCCEQFGNTHKLLSSLQISIIHLSIR